MPVAKTIYTTERRRARCLLRWTLTWTSPARLRRGWRAAWALGRLRRGAKGIALVDNSGDAPRLRYVFDIADTGTRRNSRPFSPWEINDGNLGEVQLGLRQAFNAEGEWLSSQLQDVARDLAEMYFDAHRHDIAGIIDGSLMAGYDDGELRDSFIERQLHKSRLCQHSLRPA